MAARKRSVFDYVILTGTYNRGKLFERLCSLLAVETERIDARVLHVVINDASTKEKSCYQRVENRYLTESPYSVLMRWNSSNGGSANFWKLVNRGFDIIQEYDFRYLIMIPDDLTPCTRFLTRITDALIAEQKRDSRVIALNLKPALLKNYGTIRYLDDAFISTRELPKILNWKLQAPTGRWKDNFKTGSGTGFQMTRRIAESNFVIAPNSDVSYLQTLDVPSVMFKNRASPTLWARKNFVDVRKTDADR
jgi:hypothetical protein